MDPMFAASKSRALTLVEVLVVIAILALIAGIMFPVVSGVKENARSTTCISNLKQLGIALHVYSENYQGYAPPYETQSVAVTPGPIFLEPEAKKWVDSFEVYGMTKSLHRCPSDPFYGGTVPQPSPVHDAIDTSYVTSFFISSEMRVGPRWPDGRAKVYVNDPPQYSISYAADRLDHFKGQKARTGHGSKINALRFDGSVFAWPLKAGR